MNIHTIQFSHILETRDFEHLHAFLSRTAFVISHKSEDMETLLSVLWYLPIDSPVIIVSNCQERERETLARTLKTQLAHHKRIYLIHQKDEYIAGFFKACGVYHLLGEDGRIRDGKGEGMYIGALCAYQLGYPQWIVFYDADNLVPSALLEYTLAMGRLFLSPRRTEEGDALAYLPSLPQSLPIPRTEFTPLREGGVDDALIVQRPVSSLSIEDIHAVRICWPSKPELGSGSWDTKVMGRCSRVVSPLFNGLLEEWFGIRDHVIRSSNAGEQGMTVKAAISLRFSSGFSVETLQLLDLFVHARQGKNGSGSIVFQQYLSKSLHFHEKKGDEHIKKMIEESLGSFFHFESSLPDTVKRALQVVYDELRLERVYPALYPPLQDLPLQRMETVVDRYLLCADTDCERASAWNGRDDAFDCSAPWRNVV